MLKILIVDDEREICGFVKNFFEERGYDVFTAYDGETALSIAREEALAVVLLDIRLKGMDGIAVLKYIREHDRSVKVIMLSALNDQDKMDEAYRLGASDYIVKPLELEHLENVIEKAVK